MFDIKATETYHSIYSIKWELTLLTVIAVSVQRLHSLTGWSASQMKGKVNVAVTVLC